ncbi:MAG: dihydroorotate dehydrogenase electron transfer subunit [Geminicoccaceae bacterium]|nr:MAG: dihydroorotate dehydrogenase electron transfer subunit [Geminicoccaceae bacterium]
MLHQEPLPSTHDASIGRRVGEHLCVVRSNSAVNADYRLMRLSAPAGALAAEPGQFFHILCPATADGTPFLRRPMSVYHVDVAGEAIGFLYKVHGAGTRVLDALQPGATLDVLGPLGRGFTLDAAWRRIVLVGRGVGLATLAPLAVRAAAAGVGVTAVLSVRRPDLVMSVDLLSRCGADVHVVHDADGSSDVAAVGRLITQLLDQHPADAVFTCGSSRLLTLLQGIAKARGLYGEVALEQQMACGLSMCFCCVRAFKVGDEVEHRRVCWEGPVFDLQEALP